MSPGSRLLTVAVLAACTHGEPSTSVTVPDNAPVMIWLAQRLTFNPEGDWAPAWLPDGSGIGYSYHVPERSDRDRCLAFLPAAGGRIARMICLGGSGGGDSTDAVLAHAVSPGGRLALIAEAGDTANFAPARRTLYLGRTDDPDRLEAVLSLPLAATSGLTHPSAAQLAWRDESTLVYLARAIQYLGAPPDTNDAGLEIGVLSFGAGGVVASAVPGTAGATSVALDPVTGAAYATFAFDSNVYVVDLATGQRQVAASFAAFGVPRDVQAANGRLVAVVQGRLAPAPAALFGVATQFDEGGEIAMAPVGGTPTIVAYPISHWFRSLALSPSGERLVAEAFVLTIKARFEGQENSPIDSIVAHASDLWLISLP